MLRLIKNEFIKSFSLIKILIFTTIMIIFSFTIIESQFTYDVEPSLMAKGAIERSSLEYQMDLYKSNPSNDILCLIYIYKLNVEVEDIQNSKSFYNDSWQSSLINTIKESHIQIASLQMIKDGYKATSFKNGMMNQYYTEDEVNSNLNSLLSERANNLDLLKNGTYVNYEKMQIASLKKAIKDQAGNNDLIALNKDLIKLKQYIIDSNITDDKDLKITAEKQLEELVYKKTYSVFSEKEFNDDYNKIQEYKTYDNYISFIKNKEKRIGAEYKRLWYAMENGTQLTNDTKNIINDFFILTFFISFIVIICYASVMACEYRSGSIRLLLTQGPKRYKILLSKYISIILSAYAIYIIFLIVYILLSLRKGSINDLSIPQLIMFNGHPMLINYIVYLLGQILIYSLPTIFIITLVFMISTLKKGSVLATTIGIILSLLSLFPDIVFLPIYILQWYFLKYIPISYLSFLIINSIDYDNQSLYILNQNLGIIVLIISIIIMYIITHLVFTKSDIRN